MAAERRVHYRFANTSCSTVDVWVAQPPYERLQVRRSHEPAGVAGGVERYRLPPFASLTIEWTAGSPALLAGDPSQHLGGSPQIPRHPAIASLAREVAGARGGAGEIARALFEHVAHGYRYAYPVLRRGALEMLEAGGGDCGQFCVLLAALCRSLDIPARVIFGTLMFGDRALPHAWVEIWIDGRWVAADPALANARGGGFFDFAGDDRFAFSIGVDIPIDDYGPPVRPIPPLSRGVFTFGGRPLHWGFETIDGTVPYLQPAYPRCAPGRGFNWLLRQSQIGQWSLNRDRLRRAGALAFVRATGFLIGLGIAAGLFAVSLLSVR